MFWPFKKYDVEMSPEVRGVIKLDGKPQVGLTVHRELFYEGYKKGKTLKDEAQTNELGEFFFPGVTVRSRAPGDIFGGSLNVHQKIYLNWQGDQKKVWGVWVPPDGRKPLLSMLSDINCELTNIERIHEVEIAPEKVYLYLFTRFVIGATTESPLICTTKTLILTLQKRI